MIIDCLKKLIFDLIAILLASSLADDLTDLLLDIIELLYFLSSYKR